METAMTGRFLTDIRPMTDEELQEENWTVPAGHSPPTVLEFADGTVLFPSQDPEGNGPGSMFGRDSDGDAFQISH
jgi:hypothetical protein